MRRVASIALTVAGIIHIVPVAGVLGAARLEAIYGVSVTDTTVELLLRHRALQLALVGVLLLVAAKRAALQSVAITAGVVSAGSFLLLAWPADHGAPISRVIAFDLFALGRMVAAGIARRGR